MPSQGEKSNPSQGPNAGPNGNGRQGQPGSTVTKKKATRADIVRRSIMALVVLAAIGLFALGGVLADTGGSGNSTGGEVVERLIPGENEEVLQQSRIALDLETGWGVASLNVNGVAIPEADWKVTSELGLYEFIPADGQTVEALDPDENCVDAVVFNLADLSNRRTVNWCFTVA